jgi:hypothetical protein
LDAEERPRRSGWAEQIAATSAEFCSAEQFKTYTLFPTAQEKFVKIFKRAISSKIDRANINFWRCSVASGWSGTSTALADS